MKIKKPLGNNAVLIQENGMEQVAIGNGIGFKKREGDLVDKDKIQSIYILKGSSSLHADVKRALQNIQPDSLIMASKIIQQGEKELGYKCNDMILLSLADHIDLAVSRAKDHAFFSMPLEWDIKMIYPAEYVYSLKALQMIKEELHVEMPDEEAPFIAMHFINSQMNEFGSLTDMTETILYTGIIQNILDITRYHYGFKLDQNSFDFSRLIVHVRYFVKRQLNAIPDKSGGMFLNVIAEKCPFDYECAKKIKKFLQDTYKWEIDPGEIAYLTLHLNRVSAGAIH